MSQSHQIHYDQKKRTMYCTLEQCIVQCIVCYQNVINFLSITCVKLTMTKRREQCIVHSMISEHKKKCINYMYQIHCDRPNNVYLETHTDSRVPWCCTQYVRIQYWTYNIGNQVYRHWSMYTWEWDDAWDRKGGKGRIDKDEN